MPTVAKRNREVDDSLAVLRAPVWVQGRDNELLWLKRALAPALDLHEGIPDPGATGCPRWPEPLRLRASSGELVRGRCRATNQCDYCAKLAAVENAELLALDAMDGDSPEVFSVLTSASGNPDPAHFEAARRAVFKALKRRWPDCRYAGLLEFSTGEGRSSGGIRRPHWNLLWKGIPADAADQAHDVILSVWCNRDEFRAARSAQFTGAVSEFGGLMRYLALHFQKESQQPPAGWRGHRFTMSRGHAQYLNGGTTPELRERAKRSLRAKREVWRAIRDGYEGESAEAVAQARLERADALSWELVRLTERELSPSLAKPDELHLAALFAVANARPAFKVGAPTAECRGPAADAPRGEHATTGGDLRPHRSRSG